MLSHTIREFKNAVRKDIPFDATKLCCAHSLSEENGAALSAQAGEKRLAEGFKKASFTRFRRAKATPFNLILEAKP